HLLMTLPRADLFATLPPVWPEELLPRIGKALRAVRRQLVVLDDDPTGTQTVHDVAVVTRWGVATLRAAFLRHASGFYILTNSRALPPAAARALALELGRNLRAAAAEAGCEFAVASRSDSTLRGHFPLETDALAETLGDFDATLI